MATMSARYTVIDGEVVAQERNGVRHQRVDDSIGSTVALYDNAGTKTDTFSYWPYGEIAQRTGNTNIIFKFMNNIPEVANVYYFMNNSVYKSNYALNINSTWVRFKKKFPVNTHFKFMNNAQGSPEKNKLNDPKLSPELRGICNIFATKESRVCAQECIKKLFPGADQELIGQRIGCMQTWCRKPRVVRDKCYGYALSTCGHAGVHQGSGGFITLCETSYDPEIQSGCCSESSRACTVIHEALHMCGQMDDHHLLLHQISVCIVTDCFGINNNGRKFSCPGANSPDPRDIGKPRELLPF